MLSLHRWHQFFVQLVIKALEMPHKGAHTAVVIGQPIVISDYDDLIFVITLHKPTQCSSGCLVGFEYQPQPAFRPIYGFIRLTNIAAV